MVGLAFQLRRWPIRRIAFCSAFFAIAFLLPPLASGQGARDVPLFEFHSNFWMNLHHTLYREAVRIQQNVPVKPLDEAALSKSEKAAWDQAVQYYVSTYRSRRLLFDNDLVTINNQLAETVDDGSKLPSVANPELTQLKSVAEIYRKYWWPEHDKANREWIAAMEPRVVRDGPMITAAMAGLLQEPFPTTPHRIDITYYVSEIGGAYTTERPGHTTLSSARNQPDDAGFEIVFHEAAHVMTGKLEQLLDTECKKQQKDCADLWHAVQFYTVGEVVKKQLASEKIIYTPYAEQFGLWQRGRWPSYHKAIMDAWKPYLDGKMNFATAVAALAREL